MSELALSEKLEEKKDLSQALQNLFQPTSGEEDMLRVATKYSLQLTAEQVKLLLYIKYVAKIVKPDTGEKLDAFVADYLEYKQYNNSALFVMRLFEFLSLKKYLGQGMEIKVDK